jgi:hypothetical protein
MDGRLRRRNTEVAVVRFRQLGGSVEQAKNDLFWPLGEYRWSMRKLGPWMAIVFIALLGAAPATGAPLGEQGLFVALPHWSGSGQTAEGNLESLPQQLGRWSRESSTGAFSWDPVTIAPLPLQESLPGCSETNYRIKWVEAVAAAARSRGFDLPNDYSALAIVLPQGFAQTCLSRAVAAGYKTDNCQIVQSAYCGLSLYSYEYARYPVIAHEIGHTIGMAHANSISCRTQSGAPVALDWSGSCSPIEYGDSFDLMGRGMGAPPLLHSAYADALGWLPDRQIKRIGGNWGYASITLNHYGNTNGQRAIAVEMPGAPELGGRSPGTLYIEYRGDSGLDSILYRPQDGLRHLCLPLTPKHQIYLRLLITDIEVLKRLFPRRDWRIGQPISFLLDLNPKTPGTRCDGGMAPERLWRDPTGKLWIGWARSPDLSLARVSMLLLD